MKKPALLTDVILAEYLLRNAEIDVPDPLPEQDGKITFKIDYSLEEIEGEKLGKDDIFNFTADLTLTAYDGDDGEGEDGVVLDVTMRMVFFFIAKKTIQVASVQQNAWLFHTIMRPIVVNQLQKFLEATPMKGVPAFLMTDAQI